MRTHVKNRVRLLTLITGVALTQHGQATAQSFTNLYGFTGAGDGANPWGGLVLSHNTLYGTSYAGGSASSGIVFAINIDGSGFTNLYDFTGQADGANPYAALLLSGNTLFGTASSGGAFGSGTVFAINTDGTRFTTLHGFSGGGDGGNPWAALLLSGNTLYGTTQAGGSSTRGTVFAVSTTGTGFTTLHSFAGTSDGASPYGGLILSGNVLYGTAHGGGTSGNGTVFALNTDGTGFTNLYSFTATSGSPLANADGAGPWAGLIVSGNTLFGVAAGGGSSGNGTVFALNTDGTGFTNLYTFTATSGPNLANSDGASPVAALSLSGGTLYGTAQVGGTSGSGTVFALSTNGMGFTNLHNFSSIPALNSPNNDGAYPDAGLILSNNTLYGTAYSGGRSGFGTVFSLSLASASPPPLTITLSAAAVILTWPTNATGFTLASATNLVSPAWAAVSPGPVVVNGLNTVTNPITGTQQFYRLSQ